MSGGSGGIAPLVVIWERMKVSGYLCASTDEWAPDAVVRVATPELPSVC